MHFSVMLCLRGAGLEAAFKRAEAAHLQCEGPKARRCVSAEG